MTLADLLTGIGIGMFALAWFRRRVLPLCVYATALIVAAVVIRAMGATR